MCFDFDDNLIKVTDYTIKGKLPDPFLMNDGKRVQSLEDWVVRREEIKKLAIDLQFGPSLPAPEVMDVEPVYVPELAGNCAWYRITCGTKQKTLSFMMTVFKADVTKPCPVMICGDHCFPRIYNREFIHSCTDNGVTLVMFNRTEILPDIAEYNTECMIPGSGEFNKSMDLVKANSEGRVVGPLKDVYSDIEFSTLMGWAWGYSRCVDALEILGLCDESAITFTGHSRGGKACLLAGMLDERASIVNPVSSCAGGCSCYRFSYTAVREDGKVASSEEISNIFLHFPTWMGSGMRKYIDHEDELPFDAHFSEALIAPRTLVITQSASDIMASPLGSYLAVEGAREVYKFLGAEDNLLWYCKRGGHEHTPDDIKKVVNVIRHKKYGEPLEKPFFNLPCKRPDKLFDWSAPERK